ncbi:MAG TPA: Holliday junction resolvase RuvX [Patescibacteria group bacterium]|nr:Holliday junction resolvase RuvX [Patescibacteria group bacterium]
MKILGIDYGESKVGLAIGDTDSKVATPYNTIKNRNANILIKDITSVCQQESIDQIIVGLPINDQANSSGQIKKIEKFIADLKTATSLEVLAEDERFSTQMAHTMTGDGKKDDSVSAMIILQSYFDKGSMTNDQAPNNK